MLNKPDLHPNAVMNQWILVILMFDFELVHIPGAKHKGPDSLSRWRIAEAMGEESGEGVEEAEDWVDEVLGCGVWVAGSLAGSEVLVMVAGGARGDRDITSEEKGEGDKLDGFDGFLEVWNEDNRVKEREKELREIRTFLEMMKLLEGLTDKNKQTFL
ncbi:hypothetical protein AN958_06153 [Leucoagaricus sp. SymC.cos]|nr:hypothetical protein AN958_06153 [Leucoagaricus sp. SymC.cos]